MDMNAYMIKCRKPASMFFCQLDQKMNIVYFILLFFITAAGFDRANGRSAQKGKQSHCAENNCLSMSESPLYIVELKYSSFGTQKV